MPSVEYKGHAHPYVENKIPKLSDANSNGQFVQVKCTWCKITRFYRPQDIMVLLEGNPHVLNLQRRFRCERCNRKDYMAVEFTSPSASENVGLVVRELVDVKMVKRPIWRDRKI